MIDVQQALTLAEEWYPEGPELLAQYLEIEVQYNKLVGCDGWCLSCGRPLIQINSDSPRVRQRFTLAHELVHLLLGTVPEIRTRLSTPFEPDWREEKGANRVASQILLPLSRLCRYVSGLPIDAKTLAKLAQEAIISETTAARRVVDTAETLGLIAASVVLFDGAKPKWIYSPSIHLNEYDSISIFQRVCANDSDIYRYEDEEGRIVAAALLKRTYSPTLFIQRLTSNHGKQASLDELRRWLFAGDKSFEGSVNGCLSVFSKEAASSTLDEALEAFNEKYRGRWSGPLGKKIDSPRGQQFLRLRLSMWCKT